MNLALIRALRAAMLILAASSAISGAQAAPAGSYRLGVFPYMAPRQTIAFFGPVATSLERALGHPVKLESVPTFGDFTEAISRQAYDIALIQPFDYPLVVESLGYLPLAQMSVPLVSQFYVRQDSRYQKLADLRGTTIAMPPAESANARLSLRALHDNKLIPGLDVQVRYFNSHDSCIQQVWAGLASACGTAKPPIAVFEQRMQARLRPIHDSPPIPHIMFVAHPRVPPAHRALLRDAIVGWSQHEEGHALLKNLGFPGFVPARPAEYAMMRKYIPTLPAAEAGAREGKDLVLGVFPFLAARQLAQNFALALPALSKAAAAQIHLRTASNFDVFGKNMLNGTYDVVLVQPFEYADATRAGYLPLARMKDYLQGHFWVREQSPYNKLADFKGATVAMAPVDSAQARLGRHALIQAGLTPGRDVAINYRPTHDSCLREVQRGTAAACVTAQITLQMLPPELTGKLRSVGATQRIPGVAILAHKRLPPAMRERLKQEVLSWSGSESGKKILHAMAFGEFAPVQVGDYQNLPRQEAR